MSAWIRGRRSRRLLLAASLVFAILNAAFSHPAPARAQAGGAQATPVSVDRVLPTATFPR